MRYVHVDCQVYLLDRIPVFLYIMLVSVSVKRCQICASQIVTELFMYQTELDNSVCTKLADEIKIK